VGTNEFRWDIQGLRAIAVLAVVVFHIAPNHFPGGYIGVDIFFVISGYLIMGHIWKELNNNSFSYINFYSRRIKRLFPALLATILLSSIFAWVLLLPGEFYDFCKSVVSSVLYVSNFWFYTKAGYFDSELLNSPLLHTWSLSVEEQFYIFTPLILAFCFNKKIPIHTVLIVLTILSLIFSELLLHIDESLSFYASPSRFWQFMVGGALSIHFTENNLKKEFREVICSLSILGLCISIFFLANSNFPGIKAIIPTLATAAIIYSCKPQDISYKVLSNQLFRFFGNISYSLYLWHWPVIIFYKLSIEGSLQIEDGALMLLISILLGYFSYKLIENPFKNMNVRLKSIRPIVASVVTTCIVLALAYQLPKEQSKNYTKEQIVYEGYLKYPAVEFRGGKCFITSKSNNFRYYDQKECVVASPKKYNIMLIGDSHAAHWYAAIKDSLDINKSLTQVTASGCKPLVNSEGRKRCTDLINWAYNSLLEQYHFDMIVISARWSHDNIEKLEATISHLQKHTNNIVILGPIIEYDNDLPRLLAQGNNANEIMARSRYNKINSIDQKLLVAAESNHAKYISVLDIICPDKSNCVTTIDDIPIQFDYGHLTNKGAKYLFSKMDI